MSAQRQTFFWRRVLGAELVDALDENRLGELVPAAAGLYSWRRHFLPPRSAQADPTALLKWVSGISDAPSARIGKTALRHCVWSDGLTIGGGGLTRDKLDQLSSLAARPRTRAVVLEFIESLSQFSPAIYVGQTNDLRKRTRDHLRGETELLAYLHDSLSLEWSDVALNFYALATSEAMPESAKSVQELFELIAQRLLAPIGTSRPG